MGGVEPPNVQTAPVLLIRLLISKLFGQHRHLRLTVWAGQVIRSSGASRDYPISTLSFRCRYGSWQITPFGNSTTALSLKRETHRQFGNREYRIRSLPPLVS